MCILRTSYWLCRILKEQAWTFCLKEKIKIRCRGERWQLMKHSLFFSVFICPLEFTGNSVQRFQKCPHWRAFSKSFDDRIHLIRARATPQNNFPFSKDPDTYVWIVSECGECFVCCKVLFQQADKFDSQKVSAHFLVKKWDLLTEQEFWFVSRVFYMLVFNQC